MRTICYDYYVVDVPGDCADSLEELAEIAIAEARERTRLYCIPANWYAKWICGEIGGWVVRFKVCRQRRVRQHRVQQRRVQQQQCKV
jgi:hypothetical protein